MKSPKTLTQALPQNKNYIAPRPCPKCESSEHAVRTFDEFFRDMMFINCRCNACSLDYYIQFDRNITTLTEDDCYVPYD